MTDEISDERRAEHDASVEETARSLALLTKDGREPDAWERQALAEAINCIFRGAYRLATANAVLALTPLEQRSPAARLDASLDQIESASLHRAFAEARRAPVQVLPHLGPINVYVG